MKVARNICEDLLIIHGSLFFTKWRLMEIISIFKFASLPVYILIAISRSVCVLLLVISVESRLSQIYGFIVPRGRGRTWTLFISL